MSSTTTSVTTKAGLLNEEEDALSDQFELVLEEVFRRFAVTADGTQSTGEVKVGNLSLRKKELDAFSEATNGAGQ